MSSSPRLDFLDTAAEPLLAAILLLEVGLLEKLAEDSEPRIVDELLGLTVSSVLEATCWSATDDI